jgi:UDP-GlcNAc:undecaprenyl-phosphate GlcNAc-1-phosphate transferase
MNIPLIASAILVFFFGSAAIRFAIPIALRWQLIDVPTSRRRHDHPMPIVGGAALFSAWFCGIFIYCISNQQWFHQNTAAVLSVMLSVALLVGLGLVDDLRGVGPGGKLLVQFAAAAIVLAFEPAVHSFCLYWVERVGSMAWLFAAVWLVGLSNAINLVDGLDGLAGGISILAASSLLAMCAKWGARGDFGIVMMALLIPAIGAFLAKNWHPAKLFLGDNGSLPLGFLFGVISLHCPTGDRAWTQVICIVLMMGYPILDMGLCVVRRYSKGTPLFKADRNHLHHRLLRLGLTVPQACRLLLSITLYLQITALCVADFMATFSGVLYVSSIGFSLFSLVYLLRSIERSRMSRLSHGAHTHGIAVAENTPQFRVCTLAKIELEPLYESGLFEEKRRVHDVISSLKLMLQTLVRKEDHVFQAKGHLNIVFAEAAYNKETITKLESALREKLSLFRKVYNIQYSLADLPVKFEQQEFLFRGDALQNSQSEEGAEPAKVA